MSTTIQTKTYKIIITVDEDGRFVGRCDEVHASSYGETFGQVIENMKEAVGLGAEAIDNITNFNMLIIEK